MSLKTITLLMHPDYVLIALADFKTAIPAMPCISDLLVVTNGRSAATRRFHSFGNEVHHGSVFIRK